MVHLGGTLSGGKSNQGSFGETMGDVAVLLHLAVRTNRIEVGIVIEIGGGGEGGWVRGMAEVGDLYLHTGGNCLLTVEIPGTAHDLLTFAGVSLALGPEGKDSGTDLYPEVEAEVVTGVGVGVGVWAGVVVPVEVEVVTGVGVEVGVGVKVEEEGDLLLAATLRIQAIPEVTLREVDPILVLLCHLALIAVDRGDRLSLSIVV